MLGSLFNFSGKINSFLKSSKVLIYFRAMAAEAEAAREARAKVIAAEGEHKASRSLRQAAEVIMDSPAALQVVNIVVSTVQTKIKWFFQCNKVILHFSY